MAFFYKKIQNNMTLAVFYSAIILALTLFVSVLVGVVALVSVRDTGDAISVTGSTNKHVVSDSVKWSSNISRTVREKGLKDGYALMSKDLSDVLNFFKTNGYTEKDLNISPVFMDQVYDYRANQDPNAEKEYTLRQNIEIQSSDVEKVTAMAKNVQSLISRGVLFSAGAPQYYYSKLSDLRVELLSMAIRDAKARAEQIAKSGGKKVGSLKSASSGVVQVLAPNSLEIMDYGTYDTSSVEKDIMVTVKAVFSIK